MLSELRVRDLAVIADVSVPLTPGLNVLTGETGAGKSMIVDALALLLGERANADVVRPGAARAVVEAVFEPSGAAAKAVRSGVEELGLELDEGRLVVRRDINAEGRNRAWGNGSPTTVAALAALGAILVDLHGQHEAQSLLRPATQRDLLDAFGEALAERDRVRVAHQAAQAARQRELALTTQRDDVRKRADYLRHVAKEIRDAAPKPGEDESLAAEVKRLGNVEELTKVGSQLAELLDGDEGGTVEAVGTATRLLQQLERLDPGVNPEWAGLLDSAYTALDELARALRAYVSGIDADPGRLEEAQRRRDVLYRLTQKYGPTIADVVEAGAKAAQELDLLDTADGDLASVREKREAAEKELTAAARALSAKRKTAGTRLAKAVDALLPGLGMSDGHFSVDLQAAPTVAADGGDVVTFHVKLNVGLEARPLAQVASGGELSRLMLALKVVLARQDSVPTLVFDEVDQGIGGEVAVQVADALAKVAEQRQVLVITHLPQIAARAAHHLKVAKRPKGGIATADVTSLGAEERVVEIARMLGDAADPVLRRHAEELLGRGSATVKPTPRRNAGTAERR